MKTCNAFMMVMILISVISILFLLCSSETKRPMLTRVLCMAIISFTILGYVKTMVSPKEYIHTSTEYIVALQDNNLTNSKYYMRSARVNEELWYQYMYKYGSGYKTNKCKARTAIVYCKDDETPRVEWYDVEKSWFWFKFIGDKYKKIYIPKGSIIEDFSIDLQ